MLYWAAALFVGAAAGLYELNRPTAARRRWYDGLCPCAKRAPPLGERWGRLVAEAGRLWRDPSPWQLSRCCAAAGALLAWPAGAPFLRVPFDEDYYDQVYENQFYHGCTRGAAALVPVYEPGDLTGGGPAAARPEKMCAARAALECRTLYVRWSRPLTAATAEGRQC